MAAPRFYVGKDIGSRGIARIGVINAPYTKIAKIFGSPSLSEAAGDSFDGTETVCWKIKFETGHVGEITDVSGFGDKKDYKQCTRWNIFGHEPVVMEFIKAYIK
jgi:hypothetical protein